MECQNKEQRVASKIIDAMYEFQNEDKLIKKVIEILKKEYGNEKN